MAAKMKILNLLTAQNIKFQVIQHPPVYTAAEADRYMGAYDFVKTKNLLLTNRQHSQFYLVLLAENRRLDIRWFRQVVQTTRLSFASVTDLKAQLGLTPGAVSPFGLVNNTAHNVHLYVDSDVYRAKTIGCHPNVNTSTVVLDTADLWAFLAQYQFEAHPLDFE